ncbi:S-layer homology domain-containing protein, partial [Candidatus Peregrinibacteria bacterium]|nr:S-layer homology domain-containing protein [Candidatus Peregrinibacteria bacterium]
MKKILKWLSLPVIIFLLCVQVAYAADIDVFGDVDSEDPSETAIHYLKGNEVIHGYPDGTFKSKNKINRAEFLKIVIGSLPEFNPDTEDGKNCFSDVKDEWFAKYVCYAEEEGIVSGYSDGTFQPAANINFAEASKIVANAFDIDPSDTDKSDPWYRTFVEPLAERKAIPTSISDLDKSIARGEMAEVIYRVQEEDT